MKLTTEMIKKMIKEILEESDEDGSIYAMRGARPMDYKSGPKGPREPSVGGGNPDLLLIDYWNSMKGLLKMGMVIGVSTSKYRKMEQLAVNEPELADALAKGRVYDNGEGAQREE